MQPIYLEIPRPINKSIFRAISSRLSDIGLSAEMVEDNSQWIKIDITHDLDGMEIVDAMQDMEIEVAIYEGEPKEDLSNQIF